MGKHILILGATAAGLSKIVSDAGFVVVEEDMIRESAAIERQLEKMRVREFEEIQELCCDPRMAGNGKRNKSDRKRNKAQRWR